MIMIIKAFTNTGILFIPHQFLVSGWLFMTICIAVSLLLNITCYALLIEVSDVIDGSFPEIAQKLYGRKMRVFSEIVLALSQLGFATAYIYFITT